MSQFLPPNVSSPEAAYFQLVQQCDEHRSTATYYFAYTFFTVYALGVPLQLCILPANARLAKHRSAFLLLLFINILDVFWLLQYIWLCVEFIVGRRWVVPWNLEAYLFRVVNFCIDALYIQLALNRCMAVLDNRGQLFERLFNQRNSKVYSVLVLLTSLVYSLYTNWLPERRPFHCLGELSYFEPTTSIPNDLLGQLPDSTFYDGLQAVYMACIFVPVLMYIAAFGKLLLKFLRRKFSAQTNTGLMISVFPANNSVHPSSSNPAHKTQTNQIANFALERSRLFLLCFFSQLPYLLANGFHLYRSSRIDGQTMQVLAIFWQFFGTIFHVQQPILMLLLSRDMRRGVREDLKRAISAVKERIPF